MNLGLAFQISKDTSAALQAVPDIIREAAQSAFGMLVLILLLIAGISYGFFRKASENRRTAIFQLILAVMIGYSLLVVYLSWAEKRQLPQQQPLQGRDLKVRLLFPREDRVNYLLANVYPWVRKKSEPAMQVREDLGRVVKGQEGIELDFRELETDDLIRVIVQYGDRQWQSDD
ncbi:MAG: hypothetical protein AAB225_27035, partial [Acidobacteriota bacterium]